uniref:Pectinesterase catalytic domain-containing protein n=1 Tax=Solanum lycopersicum TaxID=4081 RepID=A0A3Q7IIY9_SOLLC
MSYLNTFTQCPIIDITIITGNRNFIDDNQPYNIAILGVTTTIHRINVIVSKDGTGDLKGQYKVLIEEGMDTKIITGNRNSIVVSKHMTLHTFRNDDRPIKHQAVTLRVESNSISFYKCRLDGFQDT